MGKYVLFVQSSLKSGRLLVEYCHSNSVKTPLRSASTHRPPAPTQFPSKRTDRKTKRREMKLNETERKRGRGKASPAPSPSFFTISSEKGRRGRSFPSYACLLSRISVSALPPFLPN